MPLMAGAWPRAEVLDMPAVEIRALSYDPRGFWLTGTDVVQEFSVRDAGELFRTFFTTMRENFVQPVSYRDLLVRAIDSLSTKLPPEKRLSINVSSNRFLLHDHELRILANFPLIDDDDTERWTNMLVNIIINLRNTHPLFASLHPEQIYYLALGGVLAWLDAGGEYRSAFETRARAQVRNTTTLGATYRMTPEGLQILTFLRSGPLFYSGIGAGDVIVAINGRDVQQMRGEEIDAFFFGEATSMVSLRYISYTTGLPGSTTVRLARIESPRVSPGQFAGWPSITVYNFGDGAAEQMKAALAGLQGDGLVIDLRAAQGGSVREALEAANLFLDGRGMVQIALRDGGRRTYTARANDRANGRRIVVLVDHSTRGTGEVFAAALTGRAAFIGTPTAGDGFYRQVFPMNAEREVEFATGEIFLMSGRSLALAGMAPAACVSSLVDAGSVARFVESLVDGSFQDNRNMPERATQADADRLRAGCPATYPGPEREHLFELAASALLANPVALRNLAAHD